MVYEAKYLGQILSQSFCLIEGQYLAQINFQIGKELGCCVDAIFGKERAKKGGGVSMKDEVDSILQGFCIAFSYLL